MLRLLLPAMTLIVATGFSWTMQRLHEEMRDFQTIRRQFLADPQRAAGLHCAASGASSACVRTVLVRSEGDWQNVCAHLRPNEFQTERYYRIRMDCVLPLPHRQLPPLETILKR